MLTTFVSSQEVYFYQLVFDLDPDHGGWLLVHTHPLLEVLWQLQNFEMIYKGLMENRCLTGYM